MIAKPPTSLLRMPASRWRRTLLVALTVSVALLLLRPSSAAAQSSAAAEKLFEQGRRLLKAKKVAAACEKFAASQRLDPALGTLLNLASCREKEGRIATAWSQFREAAELAKRAKQPKRVRFARKQAAALEPRLPRLRIVASKTTGVIVTMNGEPVDAGVFNVAVPVDPGALEIRATAPGHEDFRHKLTVTEARTFEVRIPELAKSKLAEPKLTTPASDASSSAGSPTDLGDPADPADDGADPGRGRRITGLSIGAVGLVSAGVGLGFGVRARGRWNDAFDSGGCDRDTNICYSDEGEALASSARSSALISTILVGAGVAAMAAGTVLYLTAPSKREGVQVSASVGRDDALVVLHGSF